MGLAPSPSRLFCPAAGVAPSRPVRAKTVATERPVRLLHKNAPTGTQHGVRAGEFVGQGANVHVGVVQDKVLEVDELAFEPERAGSVGEVLALDKTVADGGTSQPLVKAGQNLGGCRFYFPISNREKSGIV